MSTKTSLSEDAIDLKQPQPLQTLKITQKIQNLQTTLKLSNPKNNPKIYQTLEILN